MLKGKVFTASNALSMFRVLLLIPIYLGLSQNTTRGNIWALCFMSLAILSDFLDGYLARRLGQISDLGKILDPFADKICLIGVCLILASPARANPIPLWFLAVLFGREIVVLIGGYFIYRRQDLIMTSNIWGKSTSTVLAFTLVAYVVRLEPESAWLAWLNYRSLLWLSLSFLLVSTVTYGWRFLQAWSGRNRVVQSGFLKTGDTGSSSSSGRNRRGS